MYSRLLMLKQISIHAPLRERHTAIPLVASTQVFQSTLPCGSDIIPVFMAVSCRYFNPRSLAGATFPQLEKLFVSVISIHAPLRERLADPQLPSSCRKFQSTLPCGSDYTPTVEYHGYVFQSTLPCGSDQNPLARGLYVLDFNPRSLAGATVFPYFGD